jgi:hypothetical protein
MAEDEVSKPRPDNGRHWVRASLTTLVAIFLKDYFLKALDKIAEVLFK